MMSSTFIAYCGNAYEDGNSSSGPAERLRLGITIVDAIEDGRLDFGHAGKGITANRQVRDEGREALHVVEPAWNGSG